MEQMVYYLRYIAEKKVFVLEVVLLQQGMS
jgi:hypothetical protein